MSTTSRVVYLAPKVLECGRNDELNRGRALGTGRAGLFCSRAAGQEEEQGLQRGLSHRWAPEANRPGTTSCFLRWARPAESQTAHS